MGLGEFLQNLASQTWYANFNYKNAIMIDEKMRLNVSYFCSLYSDYKKGPLSNYQGTPYTGTETYSRTNHVIGVGLDYKF